MVNVERLKEAKKKKKITFDELSAASGVPISTIYDIFRGVTADPRAGTLEAIERALGLDRPTWTEEERALGVGEHSTALSQEEWEWLELRSGLLETMGEDYLTALIKMLEEIIKKKS